MSQDFLCAQAVVGSSSCQSLSTVQGVTETKRRQYDCHLNNAKGGDCCVGDSVPVGCRLVGSRMPGGGAQFGGGSALGKPNIDTRSGPRIFVGKLNKETSENDVKVTCMAILFFRSTLASNIVRLSLLRSVSGRSFLLVTALVQEYFTRFGYVMDVYLPRDKVNRSEHRGFGFVTFETDGAVLRIHAHGQHQIKCALAAQPSFPSVTCLPAEAERQSFLAFFFGAHLALRTSYDVSV